MSGGGGGIKKSRFDGLDIVSMVHCLQSKLIGRRVINVYDDTSSGGGDTKNTFVIKLDGYASADGENEKEFLLLQSGVRFHTVASTAVAAAANTFPSQFVMKLRKHIRGLRFEIIQQIGTDRVIVLTFGSGSSKHCILLELYAKGNIILTNATYTVLTLLRTHIYHDDKNTNATGSTAVAAVAVGQVYPVSYATSITTTATSSTTSTTSGQRDDDDIDTSAMHMKPNEFRDWIATHITKFQQQQQQQQQQSNETTGKKKKNKKKAFTLRTLLLQTANSGITHYGNNLIEHCLYTYYNKVTNDSEDTFKGDSVTNFITTPLTAEHVQPSQLQNETSTTILETLFASDTNIEALQSICLKEGQHIFQSLNSSSGETTNAETTSTATNDAFCDGYVLYREQKQQPTVTSETKVEANEGTDEADATTASPPSTTEVLEEFQPVLFQQDRTNQRLYKEFTTYDDAVRYFYANIEYQKYNTRIVTVQKAIATKLEKVKNDQQQRTDALQEQQVLLLQHAETIQYHSTNVDAALAVISSAISSGMDWDQLHHVIKIEQEQNGNPIALLIHHLDLQTNTMTLRLPATTSTDETVDEDTSGEGSDEAAPSTVDVKIVLDESAYGNAKILFDKVRVLKDKYRKTLESSNKAIHAAEKVASKQLNDITNNKRVDGGDVQQHMKKPAWFEKFRWFITTDNYLVLGGRDAHQNEQLVKRYLRPGDAYLHADVHGAASCILRAKKKRNSNGTTKTLALSELALHQAGNFTICQSSAWSSRMVTSAWWVESHQVSKTAPTGEYLSVGSFMIRGKKNFLPPTQLEMGMGVLFRLGDTDSILRHKNERRDFALLEDESDDDDGIGVNEESSKLYNKEQNERTISDLNEPSDPCVPSQSDIELENENQGKMNNDDEQSEPESSALDVTSTDEAVPLTKCTETSKAPTKKKGVSVRDRKLIKKYGSLEEAEKVMEARREVEDAKKLSSSVPINKANKIETVPQLKRGKKTKQKRAMKKYADQDDEDRDLALQLLHGGEKLQEQSKGKHVRKANEQQEAVAAETVALLVKDSAKISSNLPPDVQETLAQCVTFRATKDSDERVAWEKFDADTLEHLLELPSVEAQQAAANRLLELKTGTRIDNFSSSLSGIIRTIKKHGFEGMQNSSSATDANKQRKTKIEKQEEEAKWKQTLVQEGVVDDELDDDGIDDTAELNKLTGKPHAGDLLVAAVPVCAPYQTLAQYAYRVKLTPGNMKRGKAAKQCLEILTKSSGLKASNDSSLARQQALLKAVTDPEWIQVMCADVKISAPGASKAVKKAKTRKRKTKKSNG